jgi:adenylate cyclase
MTWDEFRSLVDMVRYLSPSLWEPIPTGEVKLAFHDMTVSNRAGELVSSIPVLRGKTLRDLCATGWEEFEAMAPGFRRDFGEPVRIPLTPQNEHIITFFGPRGKPFTSYSFYDLMKDRIHGGLDGKIFIVGSSAASTFDIVSVPLDNVYPGTEVHASLIHSFLTNTFVRRLEIWEDFLILLLVGIFMGFISYMTKPVVGAFLSIIFVFAYFLTAMTLFGTNLLWIEIARPTLTIMLTFTAVMAYRYIAEEKDRKFLQTTFKRYLSPEVIDIMYRQKQVPELGGEEGIRTAYFTDIQSFSTFSEKLGSPTRLVELLNEYLSEMTDSLLEHYGTLDKYEGDAIIAFFGAPMPMEDHAQQACLTALDMQRKLGELRRKWRSEGDKWPSIVHNMRMRIGVNTGPITTGNMGSAMRMNYTMMGDAVNLAARLESAAKQYGIYTMISHFTYDLVRDRFEARQLDKITVVGKSEPVVVYELLGERGSLDAQTGKLVSVYTEGLEAFYAQKWDRAIEILRESEKLEPYREIAPGNMTPSTRVIGYAEKLKVDPPGPDWDGVTELTAK